MIADAAAEHAVRFAGLTVGYRRRGRMLRAINDLSLDIRPGEAYGLVGESGCGKTTVAMTLMRYLPRNAVVEGGSVLFGRQDLLTLDDAELRRLRGNRMAMVYQDPGSALNPAMRIGPQVAEVYRQHLRLSRRDAADAARGMLEKVKLADAGRMLRRYPHQLSGGQLQRAMIAMALAANPDLLVLDEPTTGLDATVEAEVLDLIEELRTEIGSSILFISHNLAIVARVCERVGVLYAGHLVEEGPARELFADPRHPYTLGLLRSLPRPGMRKDQRRLEPIPGSLPPLGSHTGACSYADRCPIARDRCRVEPPPLIPLGSARFSRCFYHGEVPSIPRTTDIGAPAAALNSGRPLLRVEDLVATYETPGGDVTAVNGVSFDIRRGETFGLVGESGSGKTSLVKCIVGLTASAAGRIEFDGVEVAGRAPRRTRETRRALQMVFQNPDASLNPARSVRWILGRAITQLAGARSAERASRVAALAASVQLDQRHLRERPTALSGGQKQRVAIAAAFAGTPALVLLDEPVSALDVSVQAATLNLLADLQLSQGVSYVFISHDLGVVRYLADRIGVMYLGELVDVGPSDAVLNPPHHPYTEALVSAMPRLEPEGGRPRVRVEGAMPSATQPPSGCRFHTRCPRYLGDICRTDEPPAHVTADGNVYRCHIPPEELSALQASAQARS